MLRSCDEFAGEAGARALKALSSSEGTVANSSSAPINTRLQRLRLSRKDIKEYDVGELEGEVLVRVDQIALRKRLAFLSVNPAARLGPDCCRLIFSFLERPSKRQGYVR